MDIERAASGGVCVTHHEGQAIFVRDVLPGERARVRVTSLGRKQRFVRAELVELLQSSRHRVQPPCPVATECGGCDWQHAELSYQRVMKRDILLENLRKFGGIELPESEVEVESPIRGGFRTHIDGGVTETRSALGSGGGDLSAGSSPGSSPGSSAPDSSTLEQRNPASPDNQDAGLNYRTRMRFSIDTDGQVGLRAARSHQVIPAADCLLPVPEISDRVPNIVTNFGREQALVAVASVAADVVAAVGLSDGAGAAGSPEQAVPLHAEFGGSSTHRPVSSVVRGRVFQTDLNGFWQVHRDAPETLVETVLQFAKPQPGEQVLDLYGGAGLFTAFLAQAVKINSDDLREPGAHPNGLVETRRDQHPNSEQEGMAAARVSQSVNDLTDDSGDRPVNDSTYESATVPVSESTYELSTGTANDLSHELNYGHTHEAGTESAPESADETANGLSNARANHQAGNRSPNDGWVQLIEGDRTACNYARQNLADLDNVKVTCADMSQLSHRLIAATVDLVVADPPRAGLGGQVVTAITNTEPKRVVYVSCDSATFARDLKSFADQGYQLDQLRAFDLFPMTKHLETVALLTPNVATEIQAK